MAYNSNDSFYDEEEDEYLYQIAVEAGAEYSKHSIDDLTPSGSVYFTPPTSIRARNRTQPFHEHSNAKGLISYKPDSVTPVSTKSQAFTRGLIKKRSVNMLEEDTSPRTPTNISQPLVNSQHYIAAIKRLQSQIDKILKERNELREENRKLQGELGYYQHEVKEKERESYESRVEVNKHQQERLNLQRDFENYKREKDDEILMLKTQLQFSEEENKAKSFNENKAKSFIN